jgi:3-dehydroquinate dehydratase-2
MSWRIIVAHGPNLNLLGRREPEIYGSFTLEQINSQLQLLASESGVELKIFQSNSEGEMVSFIGDNIDWADGLIINAAAYTHTSVAIRDAISASQLTTIEVHLSNVYRREDFRHFSYISPVAAGIIAGFGPNSYILALKAMINLLENKR